MATYNAFVNAPDGDADARATPRDWRRLSNPELRQECQKGQGEIFLISHFVYRPVTLHITKLYASFRLSANAATVHSCIAALIAAAAVLWPSPWTFLVAAAGLQIYFTLDHVDGELARLWIWTGHAKPNPSGAFLDCWVHYHSVNLVFSCLGFGLAMQSGNIVWCVVGVLGSNLLGNFTKLTLARTMLRDSDRLVASDGTRTLAHHATDTEPPVFHPGRSRLKQIGRTARELLGYPGPLVILSVTLTADATVSLAGDAFSALVTEAYLVAFAAGGTIVRLVRTARVVRMLQALEYK